MGCDIHFFVEIYKDGRWQLPRIKMIKNKYRDGKWGAWGQRQPAIVPECYYEDRNYNLFALLADVRNYFKFSIVPISSARGIPNDCTQEYKDYIKELGADGHHHSWYTLQELENYDWNEDSIRWASDFYTETLPKLRALAKEYEVDSGNVRIVFCFDN